MKESVGDFDENVIVTCQRLCNSDGNHVYQTRVMKETNECLDPLGWPAPSSHPNAPKTQVKNVMKAAHAPVQPSMEAPAPRSTVESSSMNVVNEISRKSVDERAIDSQ